MSIKKPILVGGLGAAFGLWGWFEWHEELTSIATIGSGFLGLIWFVLYRNRRNYIEPGLTTIEVQSVAVIKEETAQVIINLQQEQADKDWEPFTHRLNQVETLATAGFKVAVTGSNGVGKSTLIALLQEHFPDLMLEELNQDDSTPAYADAHGVIYMVNGDLTASDWEILAELKAQHHYLIICFNKQDQYPILDRQLLLQEIIRQAGEITSQVIAIAAAPAPRKVKVYDENGGATESQEETEVEIAPLLTSLHTMLSETHQPQLILCHQWRSLQAIKQEAQGLLNHSRYQKSVPLIEKYQWVVGLGVMANPVSSLDLIVTVAVNGQMIADLGEIYGQSFSLEQGEKVALVIGEVLIKQGLVELSSQAIVGLLKSSAITYLAGGTIQAISAAYLTRVAGLSLVRYWEETPKSISQVNTSRLTELLQSVFTETQKLDLLQGFVKRSVKKLEAS